MTLECRGHDHGSFADPDMSPIRGVTDDAAWELSEGNRDGDKERERDWENGVSGILWSRKGGGKRETRRQMEKRMIEGVRERSREEIRR